MSLSCKQTSRHQCVLMRLFSNVSNIVILRGDVGETGWGYAVMLDGYIPLTANEIAKPSQ